VIWSSVRRVSWRCLRLERNHNAALISVVKSAANATTSNPVCQNKCPLVAIQASLTKDATAKFRDTNPTIKMVFKRRMLFVTTYAIEQIVR
jgi:hypothetical protein